MHTWSGDVAARQDAPLVHSISYGFQVGVDVKIIQTHFSSIFHL